jgi:hypothetical protein
MFSLLAVVCSVVAVPAVWYYSTRSCQAHHLLVNLCASEPDRVARSLVDRGYFMPDRLYLVSS